MPAPEPAPNCTTALRPRPRPASGSRPTAWFKRAVFYEIHIRGFFDANGDGSGDFRGLTEKLDYLQWLGIDCIWLLPFYRSTSETAATTSPTSPRSIRTTATSTTCTS